MNLQFPLYCQSSAEPSQNDRLPSNKNDHRVYLESNLNRRRDKYFTTRSALVCKNLHVTAGSKFNQWNCYNMNHRTSQTLGKMANSTKRILKIHKEKKDNKFAGTRNHDFRHKLIRIQYFKVQNLILKKQSDSWIRRESAKYVVAVLLLGKHFLMILFFRVLVNIFEFFRVLIYVVI